MKAIRLALLVLCVLLGGVNFASAAGPVTFSVTAQRASVRGGPGAAFPRLKTVTRGETFNVTGRAVDGAWLRINVPGIAGEAWISASLGKVNGDLNGVKTIQTAAATPTPAPTSAPSTVGPTTPVVAAATTRSRDIFQKGLGLGSNPRAFSKVGDCQSTLPFFLASFDKPGEYRLGDYGYLQETIDNFGGSFARESLAAKNGMNPASLLSPLWADAKLCEKGETPLECEYRIHKPAIAIISLGTNGAWQSDADYEASMRRIIEISIDRGVVPILSTKADNVEGGNRFNWIVAKLAAEYDAPLWNYWAAAQGLPNFGLVDEYHLSWGRPFFDDPVSMSKGWAWRNLTALQSLDAVWKGAKQ